MPFFSILSVVLVVVWTLTLNRGLIHPGVAEMPLFNNVPTIFVRGAHLEPDGALVKQLRQVARGDHLVVPTATLVNELYR